MANGGYFNGGMEVQMGGIISQPMHVRGFVDTLAFQI